MKNILLFFLVIFILTSCNCGHHANNDESNQQSSTYELVWQDEFDYEGLPDSTKWKYDTEGNDDGWGNFEAQQYTVAKPDNAWVKDGKLKITAIHEKYEEKDFTSARLISNADWKYGRVEVNAKLPNGRGTWSAIWMMPGGWSFYDGNWPDIGEIDIMEHVGHDLGIIHASAHSRDYQWQTQTQQTATMMVPDVSTQFHTYSLEWTQDVLHGYVDDSLYFQYQNKGLGESKWPYNKPFYLILNLAVGGAWGALQGIDSTAFPQTMEIDYVRVYQKTK
jgi:beta-glucanase (GH16 family)